jgi:hypothetical protein
MKSASWLCALILAAVPAFGQRPVLTVEIPFAFEAAGGKVMPAGNYEVQQLSTLFAQIRNTVEPRHGVMMQAAPWTVPSGEENQPRLVFNKYGDRHFLSQVWHPLTYYQLTKSRQERELVTSYLLAKSPGPETVVLVARFVR